MKPVVTICNAHDTGLETAHRLWRPRREGYRRDWNLQRNAAAPWEAFANDNEKTSGADVTCLGECQECLTVGIYALNEYGDG